MQTLRDKQSTLSLSYQALAELPEILLLKLEERGFRPNPSGLSEATGMPINTAYRICRADHKHRALRQVNRVSQALGWDFDYLFNLATDTDSALVAKQINEKIDELQMTKTEFYRKVFINEKYKPGNTNHTTGRVIYSHLRTYATICRKLDIEPITLAKALLRIHHYYQGRRYGNLTESKARHLNLW